MDVKTLSAMLGHVSASFTLNIYTHITGEMQANAAANIDRGITKAEVDESAKVEMQTVPQEFAPCTAPHRRPGTGCIKQLDNHLWDFGQMKNHRRIGGDFS